MTRLLPPRAALTVLLALAGCEMAPRSLDATTHPPIPTSYNWRKDVADWMKKTFNEPASLHSVMISDPVVIDDPASPATWLVCVELDPRSGSGAYMGSRRFALGFQTTHPTDVQRAANPKAVTAVQFISAGTPQQISRAQCESQGLRWQAWPDWERASNPPVGKKR
jgi:hypothetical protein